MKQRAMIAAAMACQPELLLADEPTTALDATVQAHILQLLKDLNTQKNLSLVLVSHDLAVIAQICDRVIVMRNGEVVEQGRTRDIVNSPRHAYTQQLIDSQPGRLERQEQGANRGRASKTGQPPLLQLNQLSVEFDLPGYRRNRLLPKTRKRSFRAVDDVSLELQQGECLGIVGESGSGKSTLVRAIMGLVKPASGEVSLQGQSILANAAEPRADFRRSVQMVFQNPFDSLNPKFSVWQTVAEPLRKHQLVKRDQLEERVLELLQLVELDPDLARRKPGQLSGGQCQRVGIARALAMKPRVLIADEITSALDVTIQAQIIALLNRLRAQENLSVIFISHDLALVRSFCDRAIVFRAGSIVEAGPVSEVLDRPSEAYTRTLLASAPIL
jgi:peptide/nickel transport system ATP-binding protein